MSSTGYTESHKDKGLDYHESFSPAVNPYRAMLWRLEQRALNRIADDYLAPGHVAHLDFACGTGRILAHFAARVGSSTGVDVSRSMIDVARTVAPATEFIEADLTRLDVLGDRRFDLITAFRFFPNAEPPLRRAVLGVLTRHLAPGGLLVFNNHKNRNSLRARISRLLKRELPASSMIDPEVRALVGQAGLRVVRVIPLAVLPLSEYHLPIPIPVLEALERGIGGTPALAGIAQDIIYVCAGSEPGLKAPPD